MTGPPFHCDLSPVCTAPRQGCVCFACHAVRRGVKDDEDAEDIALLTRQQAGHPAPQLPPSSDFPQ